MRIWKPFQRASKNSTCTDLLFDELDMIVRDEFISSYLLCVNRPGFDLLAVGEKAVAILEEFQSRMAKQLDPIASTDLSQARLPSHTRLDTPVEQSTEEE